MQIVKYNSIYKITLPYNRLLERNKSIVTKIPGAKFVYSEKCYHIPLSSEKWINELAKRFKAEIIVVELQKPEQVGEIAPLPSLDFDVELNASLRPYQENGIAQGIALRRLIIGDEQGLGKTLQSIGVIVGIEQKGEPAFPCLVVCPSSTKINWKREWEKFSNKKAMILDDRNKSNWHRYFEAKMAQVFIVNYESLRKFFVLKMPDKKNKESTSSDIIMDDRINILKSIIIDESHRLKDPNTQQTRISLRIANGKPNRILLSGTPVVNKPIDLFPQLAILGQLNRFGGVKGFKQRYCDGGNGATNLKELNWLLNKYCFFRREKVDVAKDLPEKQRQTILCEISNRNEYNKAINDFTQYLKDNGCSDKEVAKKLRGEILIRMLELKRISAKGKINEAKEFISDTISNGEKLIVFCNLHQIVDELKSIFPKAVTVTGRDSIEQKQASIDSFQNNPDIKLIICNIKAAGVGITLTASSRVAFIEYPWTYADCVQCEDRAHRIGQTNNVMCTYFLGKDTIDEYMYQMIQDKRSTANTITGATDEMKMDFIDNLTESLFKIA